MLLFNAFSLTRCRIVNKIVFRFESTSFDEKILTNYFFVFCHQQDDEVETCEGTVGFLQDNLEFANAIGSAIPKLEQMLLSTTLSDVLESIEFFKAGYMFNVTGTEHGMRLMLCLLYICAGNDKNEKGDAVIKAYHTVLFQTDCSGR